jgi:trehalose synthase
VSDDPEGAEVLAECAAAWEALAGADQRRVSLVSLPMDDLVENATMVNAIQRHATVIVQKSLAEGFGLTVAEAMWKARPVIASAVGGIVDQVAPGTGILLHDPSDLEAFGTALHELLVNPNELATLGAAARRRVVSDFVGDKHLAGYAELIGRLRLRSR